MSIPTSSRSRPALLMALVALSQLIFAVDFSIVFTALPSIGEALDFTPRDLQWVVSAYTLAVGGFLLVGGRAVDLLGRRRVFIVALALYAAASLVGGLATTQEMLIAARAVQGLGGALLFPATLSIINTTFAEGRERNRALSLWSAAGAGGGAIGVFLGGALTQSFGWEWVLFVNVPIAAAVALLAPLAIPRDQPVPDHVGSGVRRFDLPGALAVTCATLLLVYGLVQGPVVGWLSPDTLLALGGAALAVIVFVIIENRTASPLVPFRLFRNRSLATALFVAFIFTMVFGAVIYLLNLWLQGVRDFDPWNAALAMLPLSAAMITGTQVGRLLNNRIGARPTLIIGLLLGAGGLLFIALRMSVDGDYVTHLLPGILITGLGDGMTFTTLWVIASRGVRHDQAGVASGITSTAQQIGNPIGLSVLVTIANLGQPFDGRATLVPELNQGISAAFLTTSVVAIVTVIVVLMLLPRERAIDPSASQTRRRERHDVERRNRSSDRPERRRVPRMRG